MQKKEKEKTNHIGKLIREFISLFRTLENFRR